MKKKLHEYIGDFLKDILHRHQQENKERQRQTDNVVVWLTAISTGAIALILSQSDKLHIDNPIFLKISVSLLLLCIICGATYRSFYYPLEGLWAEKLFYFEGYCFGRTLDVSGPIEIKDHHIIKDIAQSLKDDMGLDYDHWLELDYLDRDFWVDHYNRWADYWNESEKKGITELSKAVAVLKNQDPEKAENILDSPQSDDSAVRNKIERYSFICYCSYQLILLFFVLAIVSLGVGYIYN